METESDSNTYSESDWIIVCLHIDTDFYPYLQCCVTNGIGQCLAIIKQKNPILWEHLVTNSKNLKAPQYNKTKDAAVKHIFGLVPDSLLHLKLNHSLLIQLDIVYQYLLDYQILGDSFDIVQTFSDDVTANDITRWYLPNYKYIATILSLKVHIKDRRRLGQLFSCFQLLIVSYCCFQLPSHQNFMKFFVETLIMKFIKSDMLAVKSKYPKVIQQYLSDQESYVEKYDMKTACSLHCNTITSILNLQIKIASASTSTKQDTHALRFFQMVGEICFIIESLVHSLITQHCFRKTDQHNERLAFNQCYLKRTKNISYQYVKEIICILRKRTDSIQERTHCLKIIIIELLAIVNHVKWARLKKYVERNDIHREAMIKRRLNIQSALLVSGDLDLVSEFRLMHWPSWAIDEI